MSGSVLDELRVFKKVGQKIRSTLVAGREEMVSPTVVTRSFIDSFEKMVPATSLVSEKGREKESNVSCFHDHSKKTVYYLPHGSAYYSVTRIMQLYHGSYTHLCYDLFICFSLPPTGQWY